MHLKNALQFSSMLLKMIIYKYGQSNANFVKSQKLQDQLCSVIRTDASSDLSQQYSQNFRLLITKLVFK